MARSAADPVTGSTFRDEDVIKRRGFGRNGTVRVLSRRSNVGSANLPKPAERGGVTCGTCEISPGDPSGRP